MRKEMNLSLLENPDEYWRGFKRVWFVRHILDDEQRLS